TRYGRLRRLDLLRPDGRRLVRLPPKASGSIGFPHAGLSVAPGVLRPRRCGGRILHPSHCADTPARRRGPVTLGNPCVLLVRPHHSTLMLETPLAPYLLWAKTRQPAAIDLAGSNLVPCTLDDLPGVRDAVDLSAPNDNGFAPLTAAI